MNIIFSNSRSNGKIIFVKSLKLFLLPTSGTFLCPPHIRTYTEKGKSVVNLGRIRKISPCGEVNNAAHCC